MPCAAVLLLCCCVAREMGGLIRLCGRGSDAGAMWQLVLLGPVLGAALRWEEGGSSIRDPKQANRVNPNPGGGVHGASALGIVLCGGV